MTAHLFIFHITLTVFFSLSLPAWSDGDISTVADNSDLRRPHGVYVDGSGDIYIADTNNNGIRKVDGVTGSIAPVAGNGAWGFSGDGGAALDASLNFPQGVYVDAGGDIYIADTGNHRIRKVDGGTGIITTVAGNGTLGDSGDGGSAAVASLNFPGGVYVDAGGNIYIADTDNDRVRKVTFNEPVTAVEEAGRGSLPTQLSLSQNFPNPFNSGTMLRFALTQSQVVKLAVYDLAGQQVATLVEGAREVGAYAITWDGRDDSGRELASGVYLYRLRAGKQIKTRKLLLLR